MKIQQMNHVNLIGQMASNPQIIRIKDGRKIAKFSLSTKEVYLDEQGHSKEVKNWHNITAWGKWVQVLEKLCTKGQGLAIEGKLRSRFYNKGGNLQSFTEVEINDMVIL